MRAGPRFINSTVTVTRKVCIRHSSPETEMASLIIKSKIGLERYYDNYQEDYYSDWRSDTDDEDDELPPGFAFVFDALPEYRTDNLNTTKLTFDKAKKLYTKNHTTVFRGELTVAGYMKPMDVVIKIDIFDPHSESLINEAKLYTTKLHDLQGIVVPLYYGIYHAKFGSNDVTCLVLQYCGRPVKNLFTKLDKDFKCAYNIYSTFVHPS